MIWQPKADHDLLTAGLLVVKGCGMYPTVVANWNLKPERTNLRKFQDILCQTNHGLALGWFHHTKPSLASFSSNMEGTAPVQQENTDSLEADYAASERVYTESVANLARS